MAGSHYGEGLWLVQYIKATARQEVKGGNTPARNWMAGSQGGRGQGGLSHPQAEEGWHLTSPRQTPPPRVPTAGGPTEAPHLTVDDLAQRDQYPHAALFSKPSYLFVSPSYFQNRASSISAQPWWV